MTRRHFSMAVLSARLLLTFLRCVQFLARNHTAVTILTFSNIESDELERYELQRFRLSSFSGSAIHQRMGINFSERTSMTPSNVSEPGKWHCQTILVAFCFCVAQKKARTATAENKGHMFDLQVPLSAPGKNPVLSSRLLPCSQKENRTNNGTPKNHEK